MNIPLDIKLNFVPGLKIVGLGIDSEWKGSCVVNGDTSDPNYKFEVNLDKGFIDVVGQNFSLKHGKILCSTETQGDIDIEVSAVKTVSDHKVGARFIQKSNKSDVIFFSKPHLSKNDILSYMLFEKPTSEISAGEAFTLLNIMGKISGNSGLGVVDKIKTIFGVDSLEIKQKDDSETGDAYNALSIGKKIGKLKVSIDQGSNKDTTNVQVEAEVSKHTKLRFDVGGHNNIGTGIFWTHRY